MKKFLSLSIVFLLTLLVVGTVNAAEVDLVTAASISADPAAFAKALGEDGTWIVCPTTDMTFNSELVIEGTFYNKDDSSRDIYRKVGPYAQDDNHNITERYTLVAPQFTVKSPNTRFQGGIFVGDVYVEAEGFNLSKATVVGNIYFANEEYKSSFESKDSEVTGVVEVKPEVDLVTAASITADPAAFAKALGENGTWIIAATSDMTFNSELVIEGTFYNKDDSSRDIYRKVGPYAQDDNHNITERYTLVAPQFTVKSPNTRFQGGIFVGDVYVDAEGFNLSKAIVVGNIYFANEEYKSSFESNDSEIIGVVK